MSNIVSHISNLLFDHECVVIPGFGALLTRYYPAEVNPATHMMRPPSKRVAFNSRIHENDGLIATYISKKDGVSYADALAGVEILVRGWKRILHSGKKVNLPGIGRFYLDSGSKVQFNPSIDINYHKESFGLSIFRAPAIQREIEIAGGIQKVIEKEYSKKLVKSGTNNKSSSPRYWRWAAVIAPLLALGIAAGVYLNTNDHRFYNYAGLFPFTSGSSPSADTETPVTVKTEVQPLEENTVSREDIKLPAKESLPVEAKALPATDGEKSPSKEVEAVRKGNFHIVVGSFKDRSNAYNYVKNLKGQGFDAYVAEGNADFARVAIGNFISREEASEKLTTIKRDINPGSWVYFN